MTMATENPYQPNHPVVVPGVGPVPAPGMIVGEAPGRTEIEKGIPFCGRSGGLLDSALELAGSSRDKWYITNAFKGDVGIGNRNPTTAEIEDHRPLLEAEIDRVKPRGILLLGRVATQVFVPGLGRMGDVVGTRIASDAGDYHLYPCWHPAYVLRGGHEERTEFELAVVKFVLVSEVLDEHI